MTKTELNERFFEKRDHTGRYAIHSSKTGITYYVEPVDSKSPRRSFGDINPATGQTEGSYGEKYKGSVRPEESLVSEENGFDKVHELPPGYSPNGYIEELDEERYAQGFRPGVKPPI